MAINLKERFVNALLGTPVQTESVKPYLGYGEKIDTATESLGEQPYMKPLLNQPKELGLTLDQYKEGFTQGLNYGVPEIAKLQDELGIRKPKTEAEIEDAKASAFNQPTHLVTGTSNTPRQGGFINDLVSGYRENLNNGFDVENLAPNEDKGVATRIGEGLGTLARVQSNPLARGLMAGAIGLALGGGAGGALAAGLGTAVGRQTNLTKDKAYRQNLQQMGYAQDEIDSIPGLVTDEVYGNLIRAQQLKDNAEYRNMLLKNQQINLDFQKGKEAYDRYVTGKKLSLEEQKLALDWLKTQQDKKKDNNYENPKIILDNVEQLWKKTPQGRAWIGTSKGKALQTGVGNFFGINNNDVSAFMAIAESMVTPLARQIAQEKGNVSDRDIARARAMLPQVTDSYEQGMAKIQAVRKLLNDLEQAGTKTDMPVANQTSSNQTMQVGNYKVRVK